jgi:antitoxin component HigA of HigAB toxin-antitoxin module
LKGLKTIKSISELQKALAEIEKLLLLDPDPLSEEGEALRILTNLVEDYEKRSRQRLQPDPILAILSRMDLNAFKLAIVGSSPVRPPQSLSFRRAGLNLRSLAFRKRSA